MKNDNRYFKDVVSGIKRSEKDVDKVLNAARLQRIESDKKRYELYSDIVIMMPLVITIIGIFVIIAIK